LTDEQFVAWSAGFFDGEGNVDIRYRLTRGGKYERFECRVTVVQVVRAPLDAMKGRWGGSICVPKTGIARWVVTGSECKRFLVDVTPFLLVKSEQVVAAIKFLGLCETNYPHMRLVPGARGFQRESVETRDAKLRFMNELRAARASTGVRAKTTRVVVPAIRAA